MINYIYTCNHNFKLKNVVYLRPLVKETRSVTMNIFRKKIFSFVKVELSYVFTINMFRTAENCREK